MAPEYSHRIEVSGLDCAVCGHDHVVVLAERTAECPHCGETYALVVRDGFALMESNGWTTRVLCDHVDDGRCVATV